MGTSSCLRPEPGVIKAAFRKLLGLSNVSVEDMSSVSRALEWHASGLDFADALHLAASEGARRLATFDQDFARRAKGTSDHVKVLLV